MFLDELSPSRDKGMNDQLTTVAGVTITCGAMGAFTFSFFCRDFRARLCSLFNLCDFQREGRLLLLLLPPSPPLLIGAVGLVGP